MPCRARECLRIAKVPKQHADSVDSARLCHRRFLCLSLRSGAVQLLARSSFPCLPKAIQGTRREPQAVSIPLERKDPDWMSISARGGRQCVCLMVDSFLRTFSTVKTLLGHTGGVTWAALRQKMREIRQDRSGRSGRWLVNIYDFAAAGPCI